MHPLNTGIAASWLAAAILPMKASVLVEGVALEASPVSNDTLSALTTAPAISSWTLKMSSSCRSKVSDQPW
jgi:hypothetical protein